ncbi:hypothetical protein D3C73_1606660 [compost metagenome]
MQQLAHPKYNTLLEGKMKTISIITHTAAEVFLIILIKNPGKIGDTIQQGEVKALITVVLL